MDSGQEQGFWNTKRTSELDAKLDPKLTAQRDAFGGGRRKLTYLEGHAAIAQLNRLFGYGGWSYSVDEMGVDEYTQGPPEQWSAGFFAVVTLRVGGVSRQDVGCVEVQNTGKGGSVRDNVHNVDSRSTARKGAVTDALKRAARTFGQQLGNGLYDVDDDVYAWMAAHSLEDADAGASTLRPPQPPGEGTGRGNDADPVPATKAPQTPAQGFVGAAADALAQRQPAQADREAPKSAPDPYAALRAEVVALCSVDGASLELLRRAAGGQMPQEWTEEQLRKALPWLRRRLTPSAQLSARLAAARSDAEVQALLQEAREAKDQRTISQVEYLGLHREAQTRTAALSGPLTAGAGLGVAS